MRRVAVMLFLLPLTACAPQRQARTLEMTMSAAGVTALLMKVNIGVLAITPSTDAKVHASVKLMPSNNYFWDLFTRSKSPEAIRAAIISHELSNGTLGLSVQYPGNSDSDDVNEEWTVAIPASVRINSHINIGKLQVSGIAGGVEASLNVGKVSLDIPGGTLKITANVGKIQARAPALNYGDVTLNADIGDVGLTVNGVPAGELQKGGTGSSLTYKGPGKDSINLLVNTGKVALTLSSN